MLLNIGVKFNMSDFSDFYIKFKSRQAKQLKRNLIIFFNKNGELYPESKASELINELSKLHSEKKVSFTFLSLIEYVKYLASQGYNYTDILKKSQETCEKYGTKK